MIPKGMRKRRPGAKKLLRERRAKIAEKAPQIPFMNVHERMADTLDGPPSLITAAPLQHVLVPAVFEGLYRPYRYKVFYGGRGGGKSWAMADALITLCMQRRLDVLCARELQISIKDSVHKLLVERINARNLHDFFTVTETNIFGRNGSRFSFRGLRHNIDGIRSFEGADICWVEEAHKVSMESWKILRPTIRKPGSEIWISFNPNTIHDPTWKLFIATPNARALVVKVAYRDNPWFPQVLEDERQDCLAANPDDYGWIWEGDPRVITEAQVFKHRWRVERFEIPPGVRFRQGADWGFGSDPTVLVRAFYMRGKRDKQELYVCNEAYAHDLDIDDVPHLFRRIPDARRVLIRADNGKPEMIKYMRKAGFMIKGSKKGAGSIEAGIRTLRNSGLVIHPDCVETIREMELYSHKMDPVTGDIATDIVDANNHCCDALRYAVEDVTRRGLGKAA